MATSIADAEDVGRQPAWDAEPHPFRRYGARAIDGAIFGGILAVVIGVVVGLIAPDIIRSLDALPAWASRIIGAPIDVALTALCMPFCIARFGTSPGKWLFRLRVAKPSGERLTLKEAFEREWRVAVFGFGLGIPVVSLLTLFESYSSLDDFKITKWDQKVGAQSTGQVIKGAAYLWLIAGAVLAIGLKVLGIVGLAAGASS